VWAVEVERSKIPQPPKVMNLRTNPAYWISEKKHEIKRKFCGLTNYIIAEYFNYSMPIEAK